MAGMIAFCAALIGGVTAFAGYLLGTAGGIVLELFGFVTDADRFAKWAAWVFAIIGAVAMGGFLFFLFVTDPRNFTNSPKYDGLEWFLAVLGTIVMLTTYALFGKKL